MSIKLIPTFNPGFVCVIWVETGAEEGDFKLWATDPQGIAETFLGVWKAKTVFI